MPRARLHCNRCGSAGEYRGLYDLQIESGSRIYGRHIFPASQDRNRRLLSARKCPSLFIVLSILFFTSPILAAENGHDVLRWNDK